MPAKIPFTYKYDFEYAKLETLTPLIRRVTARNPSGFTFQGTGTYIIGHGEVAVIDPGPLIDEHIEALKETLKGETVTHILITHTHFDHSPAAKPLKEFWGTKTYGYGPHGAGRIAQGVPVEEGGDMEFVPDVKINHGDIIEGKDWTIECVYTPGHTSNHICFALKEEKALLTGDHVMGWSTSVIGPPDGNMTEYMESLDLLLKRDDEIYWPTHGTSISDVKNYIRAFINHRLDRERQIVECISQGYSLISDMVPVMYTDTDPGLYGAAARSVLAAMERLVNSGTITCGGEPSLDSKYQLGAA
ncbi:MAG: MBL fold metallo-hydrolase [Pseudomonadales bacterium]|jgi:glyoxylase-like metal-dependent hydrolase (beta-lactamase superfamily II)